MTDQPAASDAHSPPAGELRWQDFPKEPTAARLVPTRATPRQGTSAVAFRGEEPAADDPLLAFVPVPHVQLRRNSIGPERQRAFIAHLAATGIVKQAALHIGASLEALYKLRKRPGAEAFDAAWDAALDRGLARLEEGALARAIEGEERLVVSGGKVLGTERRHNEALVTFFLRNRRPERYGAHIQPGHPLYERIRREVMAEMQQRSQRSEAEVIASLDQKLETIRLRQENAQALLAGTGLVALTDGADQD